MSVNPLFDVQVRLSGGWRVCYLFVVLYLALIVGFATLTYRLNSGDPAPVSSAWLGIVSASQGFFLLLAGPASIRKAVLRDFQTGMIESHRLSPMSGYKVVLGYLTGPVVILVALYAASLLAGGYFVTRVALGLTAGQAIGAWWGGQVCLLTLALFFSTLVLLGAVASAGKANLVGVIIVISAFGGWAILPLVPGVALLGGVMSGNVLWSFFGGGAPNVGAANVAAYAILAQLVYSTIFIIATAQRVRAPERPLFSMPLAFVLLVVTGVVLIAGIALRAALTTGPLARSFADVGEWIQIFSGLLTFMVIASVMLTTAAQDRFQLDRSALLGDAAPAAARRLRSATPLLLTAMTLGVAFGMLRVMRPDGAQIAVELAKPLTLLSVVAALAMSFWVDFNWVYIGRASGKNLSRALLFSWGILKLAPFVADGLLTWLSSGLNSMAYSMGRGYFAPMSPFGTLIIALIGERTPWVGLIIQAAIAAFFTWAGRRARRGLGNFVRSTPHVAPAA
ncbi:MAG: hypothetical protein CHACPFDD_00623 [Phycisphaerae bacterium]|nr:hypothetical protein [Phycisphaerae bacterium]